MTKRPGGRLRSGWTVVVRDPKGAGCVLVEVISLDFVVLRGVARPASDDESDPATAEGWRGRRGRPRRAISP